MLFDLNFRLNSGDASTPSVVVLLAAAVTGLVVSAGCDAPIGDFQSNAVYSQVISRSRSVPTETAARDVKVVIDQLFGDPNQPKWPAELIASSIETDGDGWTTMDLAALVDPDRLIRAAGAVSSDRDNTHLGLFREHCVACHGLDGGGAGPTSRFQSPYPRDFRHGVYKWKTTKRSAKPTRDDLVTLVRRGVRGTAMPSFEGVEPDDLDVLIDYVIYLSVRGEAERRLLAAAVDELGYGEEPESDDTDGDVTGDEDAGWRLVDAGVIAASDTPAGEVISDVLARVVEDWLEADNSVVSIPAAVKQLSSAQYAESVQRGRDLFHGQVVNCAGCHGPQGNGQALVLDYDDWGKEYSTRLGITPTDRDAMRVMRDAGALPPRQVSPRNLKDGVFRGSGDPETIFQQISQGIAGTPMPAVEVVTDGSGTGLTVDQAWDLVRYVLSISGQTINADSNVSADRSAMQSL